MQNKVKVGIVIFIITTIVVLLVAYSYFLGKTEEVSQVPESKNFLDERPAALHPLAKEGDVIEGTVENKEALKPRPLTEEERSILSNNKKDRTKSPELDFEEEVIVEEAQLSDTKTQIQGVIDVNHEDSAIFLKEEGSMQTYKVLISEKTEIEINGKKIHFSDLKIGDVVLIEGSEIIDRDFQIVADNIDIVSSLPIIAF